MAAKQSPPVEKWESDLTALGFTTADPTVARRLIISVSGLEKSGKTSFSLTAPGPIALFNLDVGLEGIIHKFSHKKVITFNSTIPDDVSQAPAILDQFLAAYSAVLRNPGIRTIVWDTATEVWELFRLARFGRLTQVMPYHYGPVNAEYRRLIRDAYKSDKNMILLHKMKSKYINDKRTDEYERAGFGDTPFLVQLNAVIGWRVDDDDKLEFYLKVIDCRQNSALFGEEFIGPMCNFPFLAAMVLPETSPSEWE